MAKNNIDSVAPALAVFGLDASRKPHGSYFAADEIDRAIKAAMDAGLFALRIVGDELVALASKLPRGKLFDSGSAFIPFIAMPKFTELMSVAEGAGDSLLRPEVLLQDRPAKAKNKPANAAAGGVKSQPAPTYTLPTTWASIEVGSLVLAADGLEGGYHPVVVTAINDASDVDARMLVVKFRDYPEYRLLTVKLTDVALLNLSSTGHQPEPAK